MPRKVDHELRREQLAAAVWTLARRSGVGALTVRAVGQEAGWTSGAVQHYFPGKSDLLRYAFELVQQRSVSRLEEITSGVPAEAALRATLDTLLPLDADIEAEGEIWFAFLGLAIGDPELRETARRGHREMLELVAEQVDRAVGAGVLRPGLDPADVAAELLALADGLNVQSLFRGQVFATAALRATAERRLAELAP